MNTNKPNDRHTWIYNPHIYNLLICLLTGGEVRAIQPGLNMEFTFDIFICIAILILNKEEVSRERDAASVYGYLNRLVKGWMDGWLS